jgi:hypothetical protein
MVVKSATAENAIALMRFFAEHQLDLLRRTRANAKTETEQAIFNALALKSEITVRDLQLGALRRMKADQITQVLERNVAAGKLNLRIHKENGVGRGKVVYFRPCDTCDTCDSGSSLRPEIEPRRQG